MFLRTGKKSHKIKSRKEMTREKRGNNTEAEGIGNKMGILILLVSQAQSVHLQAQTYIVLQSTPKWTSS